MRNILEEATHLYEDALINTMHVNAVQGDVLFAEMKVQDKKIISHIDCGARVNVLSIPATQLPWAWNTAIVNPLEAVVFPRRNEIFALKFIIIIEMSDLC